MNQFSRRLGVAIFLAAATLFVTGSDANDDFREWTDSSGRYHVEAQLIEAKDGVVRLGKKNRKVLAVPLEKLSTTDQEFVGKPLAPVTSEQILGKWASAQTTAGTGQSITGSLEFGKGGRLRINVGPGALLDGAATYKLADPNVLEFHVKRPGTSNTVVVRVLVLEVSESELKFRIEGQQNVETYLKQQ